VNTGRASRRFRLVQRARRLVSPVRPVLYRTRPFSVSWGLERGTPIDRVYIEEFLQHHETDIGGHVLEVKDTTYVDRFGTGVTEKDVLDLDDTNPQATICADLAAADEIPSDTFDCFVLTQTLQRVKDPARAVGHAHRILRPGGVLLASLPSITRVEESARDTDRWRFTEASCRDLFGAAFGLDRVEISTGGNVLAAVAFLMGMAAEEFSPERLALTDPNFAIVILVRAVKAGARS
jgi:SAM-dependent methyltransferase